MNKIKKLMGIIKDTLYHLKNFGFSYSLSFLVHNIISRKTIYKTRLKAISICEKKFGYIFDLAEKEYHDNIEIDYSQKNIFCFWAQGKENLPPLQKVSFESLKKYYPDYNIIILDMNNYKEYIDIDSNIVDLYKNKKISVQTLSDIIRFNLIYKYGGVWCDLTLFHFSKLPLYEYIKKYGFWSINHESKQKEELWGKVYSVTYTTFFFAANKGNTNLKVCVDFYNEYYKRYDYAIDYFMNDYILILCMKHKINFDQINKIPFIDSSPFILSEILKNGENKLPDLSRCPQKINWRTIDENRLYTFLKKQGQL